MVDFSVRLEGFDELEKALSVLPVKLAGIVMDDALRSAAKPIVKEAKARVPVKTGALKKSIVARKTTKAQRRRGVGEVIIGFKRPAAYYAHFVEYGTRYATAKPFMRPALDTKKNDALQAFKTAIEKDLIKIANELAGRSKVRFKTKRGFK